MIIAKLTTKVLTSLLVLTVGSTAFAQDAAPAKMQTKQHPAFAKRNLPTPANTLEIIAGPSSTLASGGLSYTDISIEGFDTDPTIGLNVGAAYGVNNDITVGAMVLPLTLSPDFEYGNPQVFGLYRFLRGTFEGAGKLSATIPVVEGSDFAANAGAIFRQRDAAFRADFGLTLDVVFADETVVGLNVPLAAYFQATPDIYVGLETAVVLPDFDTDLLTIPLAVEAGYTLQGPGGPMADIGLNFGFPQFVSPFSGDDAIFTDLYQVTLGATYFLYM